MDGIGIKIREARKAANLTQKQLAEKSGIIETTIRKYEIGKQKPKFENIEKIAAALNISPTELMPNRKWQGLDEHAKVIREYLHEERIFREYLQMMGYEISETVPQEDTTEIIETREDEEGNQIEETYTIKNETLYNVSKNGLTVSFNKEGFQKLKNDISKAVDFHMWEQSKQIRAEGD